MPKYTPKIGDCFLSRQDGELLVAKVEETGASVFLVSVPSKGYKNPFVYPFFYSGKAVIGGSDTYTLELIKPITPEKDPEYFL